MSQVVVLKPALVEQFETAMTRGRAVLFSAPCGFGKTTTAGALVAGRRVCALTAGQPGFALPEKEGKWDTLLLDDLQNLTCEEEQEALCRLIRGCPDKRFVLLTRGVTPHWLIPFQVAGVLTVLGPWDLALDRETAGRLLAEYGAAVSSLDLAAIHAECKGCPMPLALVAQHLIRGEPYNNATADQVRRELFLCFEEKVFLRQELSVRRLLLDLAPFEPFGPELARIVSGNSRAGELLGKFQRESTALLQERLDCYRFWPIFRRFLLWELEQTYDESQRKALYSRGGLYYELNEDYGKALECYAKSGDLAKISELLVKNAERHPGMGHYQEMEPYYRILPQAEIRSSPALMQGMSMLRAMAVDFEGSEEWYQALKDFAQTCRPADTVCREVKSRLAWLDVALPQRRVESLVELFPKVFTLLKNREVKLPPFSVTSTLPSLMNGGKDFSPWSKKDDLLYAAIRVPVEAVLGRDGVGLADCAVTESKFEKGEDVKARALALLSSLERIRRDGTPDMEFAVVSLLARAQLDAGRADDARQTMTTLGERFRSAGETRFQPNLDAMLCRIDLYRGDDEGASRWYREEAPRNPQQLYMLKRYQYLTQAMVELALGDPVAALLTLAPLEPGFAACWRYIDGIHLHVLSAIARFRLKERDWRADLGTALDTSAQFGFVRTVSQYGGAVLPLLTDCGWTGDRALLEKLIAATREQASLYPDFLRPRWELSAPLSPTETQVLRLVCAGKSNAEIGEILGIKTATVKVHVNHIFGKLNVSHRNEAREAARRLRLV